MNSVAESSVPGSVQKVADLDEDKTFTAEEAGNLVAGLFDLAANRLGDSWRLTAMEKDTIGRPLAKVLNKHWSSIGRYAEEVALGIAVASLMAAKLRDHGLQDEL